MSASVTSKEIVVGSATNRNIEDGLILQLHGLLNETVFWVDPDAEIVVKGTLAEYGEMCDRPVRVPSPLGIDYLYHLGREDDTKVMKWCPDGTEIVAFEFGDREQALAKLEDIWKSELFECESAPCPYWRFDDAQRDLEEWLKEQDPYADDVGDD